jgi:RimJ/RimL family protein N-acetyltransferase
MAGSSPAMTKRTNPALANSPGQTGSKRLGHTAEGAAPTLNPVWVVRTGRLILTPVAPADLPDLRAIKSDPRVFAMMLRGVRNTAQAASDLAADIAFWGARGYGMWAVRLLSDGSFQGVTGFSERPDGRGIALRFAFWPEAQGYGVAREAAGAALRFGHERGGLVRIVAVARESNVASRLLLGSIGMRERDSFVQGGHPMRLYESVPTKRVASSPQAKRF